MSPVTKVLIVDDHPLVREGLAARIATQPQWQVCGEAADAAGALALLRSAQPQLVIVDLALQDGHGLQLIEKIRYRNQRVKILVVSAYEESLFAERVLKAGAQGYVNKQETQGKVMDAIGAVLRGKRYFSADMTQRLVSQIVKSRSPRSGIASLSNRELEVFELIGRGRGTRAIAQQLRLSVHTIESHREKIRGKLKLRNGVELMQRAVQWRLESR